MTQITIKRTSTPNMPPSSLAEGELSVEMADPLRLWVGVPVALEPTGKKLLTLAGPEGPMGPQGLQGDPGPAGTAGATGAQGPAGADGAPGATGPAGADSTVPGPQGPAGPAGADSTVAGPQGPAGPAGADSVVPGPAGAQGPAGPPGADSVVPGPAGAAGATGAQGPPGADGAPGATGAQGPAGPAGADSVVPGPAGAPGATGAQGPPGLDGAPGTPGAQGPAGPAGADSVVPGPAGPQGVPGDPATNIVTSVHARIGAVVADVADYVQYYVPKTGGAGDAMTGPLYVTMEGPHIYFNRASVAGAAVIYSGVQVAGVLTTRWQIHLGSTAPETGGGAGSDFQIMRHDDAGLAIGMPLKISRNNGDILIGEGQSGNPAYGSNVIFRKGSSGYASVLRSFMGTFQRWNVTLGDVQAESATAAGSNFDLTAYDNNGASLGKLFWIRRDNKSIMAYGEAYKPVAGPWVSSSDERIKNIIGDYTQGLAAIKALQPIRYTYKGNDTQEAPSAPTKHGIEGTEEPDSAFRSDAAPYLQSPHRFVAQEQKECIGLSAQAAEVPMPEMISKTLGWIDGAPVNDLRIFDPNALTYALINAVKELSAEVDALKATVAGLTP